jgi:hypothetical protein
LRGNIDHGFEHNDNAEMIHVAFSSVADTHRRVPAAQRGIGRAMGAAKGRRNRSAMAGDPMSGPAASPA